MRGAWVRGVRVCANACQELSDRAAAEATYGNISTWDTSQVTDMSDLFANEAAFNDAIGLWNTTGVTTMAYMFYGASAFDQSLADWSVDEVKSMEAMFSGASKFNQPLND